jgi:hypothetical protein
MIESVIVKSPTPVLVMAPPLPSPDTAALGPEAVLWVKTDPAMLNEPRLLTAPPPSNPVLLVKIELLMVILPDRLLIAPPPPLPPTSALFVNDEFVTLVAFVPLLL